MAARGRSRSCLRPWLRRHALVSQCAPRLLGLVESESHRMQHMRRLGELNIPVCDDLDTIAAGVEKVEEGSRQKPPTCGRDPRTRTWTIIDDEPEMPEAVL